MEESLDGTFTVSHKIRISKITAGMMLCVAGCIDLVQFVLFFLPIIGWILGTLLGVFAWILFYIWYKIHGVGFLEGKLAKWILVPIASMVVSFFFSFLPELLINVALVIFVVRTEDKAIQKQIISVKTLEKLEGVLRSKGSKLRGTARLAREELQERHERRRLMVAQRNREKEEQDKQIYEEQTTGTRYQYAQDQFQNYQPSRKAA